MNTTRKFFFTALTVSVLTACGGSGGSDNDNGGNGGGTGSDGKALIQGRVIDGYVSGAEAFLDINFNGVLDSGEPSAVTGAGGVYSLDIPESLEECAMISPVIVNVPVGAVDEDRGVITKPYTMSLPPEAYLNSDISDNIVTPITSLVWNQTEAQFKNTGVELNCQTLLNKDIVDGSELTVEEMLQDVIQEAEADVAESLGLPENSKDIYKDFVAEGMSDLEDKAQDIADDLGDLELALKTFQTDMANYNLSDFEAYLANGFALTEEYGTAKNDMMYTVLVGKNDSIEKHLVMVQDPKNTTMIEGSSVYESTVYIASSDFVTNESSTAALYNMDNDTMSCESHEYTVAKLGNVDYTISTRNHSDETSKFASVRECNYVSWSDSTYSQEVTTEVAIDNLTTNTARYNFYGTQADLGFNVVINTGDFATISVDEVVDAKNVDLQPNFSDPVPAVVSYWTRFETVKESSPESLTHTRFSYDDTGLWEKWEYFKNGSPSLSCEDWVNDRTVTLSNYTTTVDNLYPWTTVSADSKDCIAHRDAEFQ